MVDSSDNSGKEIFENGRFEHLQLQRDNDGFSSIQPSVTHSVDIQQVDREVVRCD